MREIPIDSDALKANITGTAREVEIPDLYAPLVDAVGNFYGVRAKLVETLQEYSHEYRNIDALIDGFQVILLRDWSYFESSGDREKLFSLLASLLSNLLSEELTHRQTSSILRQILMWLSTGLTGPYRDSYITSAALLLRALAAKANTDTVSFLERDNLLGDTVGKTSPFKVLFPEALELYRRVLARGYRMILERLDGSRGKPDKPGGSLRGHLAAGARVVVLSAPFKSRQKSAPDPDDSLKILTVTFQSGMTPDLKGEDAAVVIEAAETHTRTGFVDVEIPVDLNGDSQQGQFRTCRIPRHPREDLRLVRQRAGQLHQPAGATYQPHLGGPLIPAEGMLT